MNNIYRIVTDSASDMGEHLADWGVTSVSLTLKFEGDDIIYVCRTAINNAHNFHDANYSTFHRIKDFRKLVAE